jgi:hypothetical protein
MREREQFSVRVYYDDGRRQYVRRFVSAQEVCRAFQHHTRSLGARLGSTVRVIIIDSSDCMVREWKFEQGVTFPPPRGKRKTAGKKSRRSDDARS